MPPRKLPASWRNLERDVGSGFWLVIIEIVGGRDQEIVQNHTGSDPAIHLQLISFVSGLTT